MKTTIKKGLRNVTRRKRPANKERRWDLKRPLSLMGNQVQFVLLHSQSRTQSPLAFWSAGGRQ